MKRHVLDTSGLTCPRTNKKLKSSHIHSMRTNDLDRFDKKFPFFRQPNEIGVFSVNIDREFKDDKSQLKYYIEPDNKNVSFDLKKGYRDMIRKNESKKEYIDFILSCICKHEDKFQLKSTKDTETGNICRNLHTDFVCWRGLLTKLLCTPYENREGWLVAVTLFNGTYYMCEFDTKQKKDREENKTEREDEMCCWGWKFEQYLTADSPTDKPNTDSAFNNCENFCTVVRSRLNQHSLGEVDAITDGRNSKAHYVEMKTTREITHPRQSISLKRFKYIKWWAQSFLVGIPEIICGYRNDVGIVNRLETLKTQQIPDLVKDLHSPWKPNVCFNFLDEFLSFIKDSVKIDDSKIVHLVTWEPNQHVNCRQLDSSSEYVFLPDWYTDVS